MDPEILSSSTILIKVCLPPLLSSPSAHPIVQRLSDSSSFITESVVASLTLMIEHVSVHRSHAALMSGVDNKNPAIRGQAVKLLLHLYQARGLEVKGTPEIDLMLDKLPKLLRDTSPEARKFSRALVRELIEAEIVPRRRLVDLLGEELVNSSLRTQLLSLSATVSQRKQLNASGPLSTQRSGYQPTLRSDSPLGRLSKQQEQELSPSPSTLVPKLTLPMPRQGAGGPPSTGTSVGAQPEPLMVSGVSPRAGSSSVAPAPQLTASQPLTKLQQENYPELAMLPDLFHAAQSKNWVERRDSLTAICDLMIQHQHLYQRANKLEKCLELFFEHFEDGSVKVPPPLLLLLSSPLDSVRSSSMRPPVC
jgi:hypothetical protein